MSKDVSPSFRLGVPPIVDVFEFARRGQVIEGVFGVNRLERLLEDVPEQPFAELMVLDQAPQTPGVVRYILQGRRSKVGKLQLVAHIQALLVLECQRCLGDLNFAIDRQTVFELVVRESDLDQGDPEDTELDAPEKLMGSANFNLLDLLEEDLNGPTGAVEIGDATGTPVHVISQELHLPFRAIDLYEGANTAHPLRVLLLKSSLTGEDHLLIGKDRRVGRGPTLHDSEEMRAFGARDPEDAPQ